MKHTILITLIATTFTFLQTFPEDLQNSNQEEISEEHPWWGLIQSTAGTACGIGSLTAGIGGVGGLMGGALLSFDKKTQNTAGLVFSLAIAGLVAAPVLGFASYKLWRKAWNSYFPNNKKTKLRSDSLRTAGYIVSTASFALSTLLHLQQMPVISIFYGYTTIKLWQKMIECNERENTYSETTKLTVETKTA